MLTVLAAAAVVVGLALCLAYRNHLLLWCLRLCGKSLQDVDSGSREWVKQHALPLALGWATALFPSLTLLINSLTCADYVAVIVQKAKSANTVWAVACCMLYSFAFFLLHAALAMLPVSSVCILLSISLMSNFSNQMQLHASSPSALPTPAAINCTVVLPVSLYFCFRHLDPDGLTDANGTQYAASSSVGYYGRRAISQQVTLGVLLGAGSFGRVYK